MKLFFLINGCLLITDRLTKYYFTSGYSAFQKNSGHFFLPADNTFFAILSSILLMLLIWLLKKNPSSPLAIGLTLIITGGLSNLFDRIVFGYIIDWINLAVLPFFTFNIADIVIVTGVLLIAVSSLSRRKHR